MHRISDRRVGGIGRESFRLFSKICGDNPMRVVSIVTTMWEAVTGEMGARREQELASNSVFFKDAIDKGARMVRHYNNQESARQVVMQLLGNNPTALRMQVELVEDRLDVKSTAAGKELRSQLERQIARLTEKVQTLQSGPNGMDEEHRRTMLALENLQNDVSRLEQRTISYLASNWRLEGTYSARSFAGVGL